MTSGTLFAHALLDDREIRQFHTRQHADVPAHVVALAGANDEEAGS